jgi:hypothetical protein
MMIFGQVQCFRCGKFVEAEGCQTETVEVETGRSGGSWSVGGSNRNGSWFSKGVLGKGTRKSGGLNLRYNSGRKYYKKEQVYICPECQTNVSIQKPEKDDGALMMSFVMLCIYGAIIFGIVKKIF